MLNVIPVTPGKIAGDFNAINPILIFVDETCFDSNSTEDQCNSIMFNPVLDLK